MKAVLSIDLPDELFEDIDNWWVEYKLSYINNGKELCTYHGEHERLVPLMPEEMASNVEPYAYNEGFTDGRNYCIDLITGENRMSDTEKLIQEMIKASNGKSNYDVGLRNGMRWVLSMIMNDEKPEFERTREQNELL